MLATTKHRIILRIEIKIFIKFCIKKRARKARLVRKYNSNNYFFLEIY